MQNLESKLEDNFSRKFSNLKLAENIPVEKKIKVPWGHISAKCFGDSLGSPILGVHGWMDNAGSFDNLVQYLPLNFYFVAVDLPGHGRSSHLPQGIPYHYTDAIMTVRRVVKYFNWNKFSWIGHSLGAGMGAFYASVFPQDVDKLIMIDLVKPIIEDSTNYAAKISMAIESFLEIEKKKSITIDFYSYDDALDRMIKATDNALTEKSAKILLIRGSRQIEEDKWVFTRDLHLRNPTIMKFSQTQCFGILQEIRCKMLVIKSTNSPWFESKEICTKVLKIYEENAASFKFTEVEGDHFVHLNEPEKIVPLINEFLHENS